MNCLGGKQRDKSAGVSRPLPQDPKAHNQNTNEEASPDNQPFNSQNVNYRPLKSQNATPRGSHQFPANINRDLKIPHPAGNQRDQMTKGGAVTRSMPNTHGHNTNQNSPRGGGTINDEMTSNMVTEDDQKHREDQYFRFISDPNRKPRFITAELKELYQHFLKGSKSQKLAKIDPNTGKRVEKDAQVLTKEGFRTQMGLLGQQQHPFLADRIFDVFDTDQDGLISFDQFAAIMDLLCNGTEDEKSQFSFALMDQKKTGYIDFDEFYNYFSQVVAHWSSLVNSHVRVDKQQIWKIFTTIDNDGDGVLYFVEYRKCLKENPNLLDWFQILNSAKDDGPGRKDLDEAPRDKEGQKSDKKQVEQVEKEMIKMGPERTKKILKLKSKSERKSQQVKQLKSEMLDLQNQTGEQLSSLMEQIAQLKTQVQEQITKKENEKKKWEESQLATSEMAKQTDLKNERLGTVGFQNATIDAFQNEESINLSTQYDQSKTAAEATSQVGSFPQSRKPAFTFSKQMTFQDKEMFAAVDKVNQYDHQMGGAMIRKQSDVDEERSTNMLLQQWNLKNNSLRKNSGFSPQSDPHFSYDFTSRNPSLKMERSPYQMGYQNTQTNRPVQFQGDAPSYKSDIKNPYINQGQEIYNESPSKTFQQILGPSSSLTDILNFDFASRYEQNQKQMQSNFDNQQPFKMASNDKAVISPIFEVLINLKKGRESVVRKVGSNKKAALQQIPQKVDKSWADQEYNSLNRVTQKYMVDDQDLILDPDSPRASIDPSQFHHEYDQMYENQPIVHPEANTRHKASFVSANTVVVPPQANKDPLGVYHSSNSSVTSFTTEGGGHYKLKVDQRRAARKMIKNQNPNQQQVFQPNMQQQTYQNQQPAAFPNTDQSLDEQQTRTSQHHHIINSAHAFSQPIIFDQMQGHKQPLRSQNMTAFTPQEPLQLSQSQQPSIIGGNAAVNVGGFQQRFETDDDLSRTNGSQFIQKYRTPSVMFKAPDSPRAEQDLLSKLDEVKSQVETFKRQIEQKKLQSTKRHRKQQASKNVNNRTRSENDFANDNLTSKKKKSEWAINEGDDSNYHEDDNLSMEFDQKEKHSDMVSLEESQGEIDPFQETTDMEESDAESLIQDLEQHAKEIQESNMLKFVNKRPSFAEKSSTTKSFQTNLNTHKALSKARIKNKSKKQRTFVHFGNDNWNLVLHMLFGIRQSVHSVQYDDVYQLTGTEFNSKYRYELEAITTKDNRNIAYEFYDFCPRMFNLIRKFYGIKPSDYLKSIGPEKLFGSLNMGEITSLKSQCSAGKSGSLFYYTADGLFMLKTISHDEFLHFRKIMKNYYEHMLAYPHTLITRFMGLHKIKFTRTTRTERVYFVIMANVFNTSQEVDVRYDLKGSTWGRQTRKDPNKPPESSVALKDLDWIEDDRVLDLLPEQRNLLVQQLQADTRFFQDNNINDYSVLLGITTLRGGTSEGTLIKKMAPKFDTLYLEGIRNRIEEDDMRKLDKNTKIKINKDEDGNLEVDKSIHEDELLLHEKNRPPKAFFEAQDGGIVSTDGTQIYFMGIIDILTNFGAKKKVENTFRAIFQDSRTVSCVPPLQYGDRFYAFMTKEVFKPIKPERLRQLTEAKLRGIQQEEEILEREVQEGHGEDYDYFAKK